MASYTWLGVYGRMSERVTVVGAGPAGLTAAITLAHANMPVTVYERHAAVGTRFHGDFQGLDNWSREEDVLSDLRAMGLEINFTAQPRYSADFYDASGHAHRISMTEPFFYLVRRGDLDGSLDRGLYAQAREAGVEFHFGSKLQRLEGPGIVATGPRYVDGICVGYLFQTDLEDLTACILSNRLAPHGYSYLLVADGRATLATCFPARRHGRDYLSTTVKAFQALFRFQMRQPRFFSGYMNIFARKQFRQRQKLYVGEAAGLQDGLWGFGIRLAMSSGYLAAQSLMHGYDYDELVRNELLPYHRVGLVNRLLWDMLGDRLFAFFLRRAEHWPDARRPFRELTGPRLSLKILYPLAEVTLERRVRYRDESCGEEDCTCVWCTCRRQPANSAPCLRLLHGL